MKAFAVSTILISFFFSNLAFADWSPLVICDNSKMVIDENLTFHEQSYQLVIRDSAIVEYLLSTAGLQRIENEKGELIVGIASGGPFIPGEQQSLFTGNVAGNVNAVISRLDPNSFKVNIVKVGYRGTSMSKLANWVFSACGVKAHSSEVEL